MSKRALALVLAVAAVVRLGLLLASLAGHFTLSEGRHAGYLLRGYGLALGYGLVEVRGKPEYRGHLGRLRQAIEAGGEPERAEAAYARAGIHFEPTLDHPPGIYLLVAAAYRLFGVPAELPLRLLGVLLDTLAAGLFYWIIATTLGPLMGVIAGILYAIYPPLAMTSIAMEPDGLLPVFLLAVLGSVIQGTRALPGRCWTWDIAAGGALGLGSYLRPDFLPIPLVFFLCLWFWTRKPVLSARRMVLVQAVALIVLMPWAIRNHALSGKWIFTSTSAGGVLINGLGSFENPWGFGYDDAALWQLAASEGIDGPFTPDGDAHFRALFLESIRSEPLAYAESVARRLPLAIATPYELGYRARDTGKTFAMLRAEGLDRYEALRQQPLAIAKAYAVPLSMAGLTFVCLLSCIAMLVCERRVLPVLALLLSLHVYSIASHSLVNLHPRYLVPTSFCWLIGLACVVGFAIARGHSPIVLPGAIAEPRSA